MRVVARLSLRASLFSRLLLSTPLLLLSSQSVRAMSSAGGGPRIRRAGTTLFVEPAGGAAPSAIVMLMHGLGDTAEGWVDVAAGMLAKALPHALFILPTAADMPVTINGGERMPAWYDIRSLSAHRELETCEGLGASQARVAALLRDAREAHGVPHARVVLAGFSQGGAMALYAGLSSPQPLAGVVVMSGYLPRPDDVRPDAAALAATPMLLAHGDRDAVVPLAYGHDAYERVRALGGKRVQWRVYPGMGHTAREDELAEIVAFLKTALPPTTAKAAAAVTAGAALA